MGGGGGQGINFLVTLVVGQFLPILVLSGGGETMYRLTYWSSSGRNEQDTYLMMSKFIYDMSKMQLWSFTKFIFTYEMSKIQIYLRYIKVLLSVSKG